MLCPCGSVVLPFPEFTTLSRNLTDREATFVRQARYEKRCSLDCMLHFPPTNARHRTFERVAGELLSPAADNIPDPLVVAGSVPDSRLPRIRFEDGTPADYNSLSKRASAASMGVGRETVVDTSLRNVGRVDCEEEGVTVEWDALEEVVEAVAKAGVPGRRLYAELHDVLVYNEESFFARHRDSKKGEGHVMTLSVTVEWVGEEDAGEVVFYEGRNEYSPSDVWWCGARGAWGAWFCTEYHEVPRLPPGAHRVAVVYNLFDDGEAPLQPPYAGSSLGALRTVDLLPLLCPFLDCAELIALGTTCQSAAAVLLSPKATAAAHLRRTLFPVARLAQQSGKREVGFVLRHSYSTDGEYAPHPSALRGADAVLYHALHDVYGTPPVLRPITVTQELPLDAADYMPGYNVVPELVRGNSASDSSGSDDEDWETRYEGMWRPNLEYDHDRGLHGKWFRGVLWGSHQGFLQRYYKADLEKDSEHHLWGNQASFDLYWYHDIAMFATIPFGEEGAVQPDTVLPSIRGIPLRDLRPPAKLTPSGFVPMVTSMELLEECVY